MYQKFIVPIDHGNRNMKTRNQIFTSGYVESDCKPALGEYLFFNDHYYILSQQRIPYMKDKTADERFFILTLFAIAMEAKGNLFTPDTILPVRLPICRSVIPLRKESSPYITRCFPVSPMSMICSWRKETSTVSSKGKRQIIPRRSSIWYGQK